MKHLNYYETLKAYADDNVEKYTIPTVSYIKENNILKYKKDAEGLVARWKAYDKTNNDVDKAILKDLSGNGHDINLKNLSYTLGSGYGLYGYDFTNSIWHKDNRYIEKFASDRITIGGVSGDVALLYIDIAFTGMRIKVIGMSPGYRLELGQGTIPPTSNSIKEDGIYYISPSASLRGFKLYKDNSDLSNEVNITITQIPQYQGGLIFDGINDYGICDNMPIFTKERGYTVCCIRKLFGVKDVAATLTKNTNWTDFNGAFIFEYKNKANRNAYNFGDANSVNIVSSPFSYQTASSYNGNSLVVGNKLDTSVLNIARAGNDTGFTDMVFYSAEIYDRNLSTDEINAVKTRMLAEWYEKAFDPAAQEYQALWTANGKTNADVDKNVPNLVDATNPLKLSNFAYAGNSGYRLFNQDFRGIRTGSSEMKEEIHLYNIFKGTAVTKLISTYWITGYNYKNTQFKVRLTSNLPTLTGYFRWKNKDEVEIRRANLIQNEIVTIPTFTNEEYASLAAYAPEFLPSIPGSPGDWYQLEQIPEGEGLYLDGVDDSFVSAKTLPALTDYTIVGDIEFLPNNSTNSVKGIGKSTNWSWFGDRIFINSVIEFGYSSGVIGFNGNGLVITTTNKTMIKTGSNIFNAIFLSIDNPQMNFKSLAIIPKILNEEQIRATYDYIKTLKANNI